MTKRLSVSLFSGAGGLDLGLNRAGFTTTLAVDENKAACGTLRTAMPGVTVLHADVHDVLNSDVLAHDGPGRRPAATLVSGFPPVLPDKNAGVTDPDGDAPQLLYRFVEAVGQARPSAFVMASTPSLSGAHWSAVLARLRSHARDLGYDTFAPVLDAADYGVPQHRELLFLIGMPKGCKPDIAAGPRAPGRVTAGAVLRALPKGRDIACPAGVSLASRPVIRNSAYSGQLLSGTGRVLDLRRPAPFITAALGGSKTPVLDLDQLESGAVPWIEFYHDHLSRQQGTPGNLDGGTGRMRRCSLRECAALQGFPPDYPFSGAALSQFRLAGAAVPPALAEAVGRSVLAGLS